MAIDAGTGFVDILPAVNAARFNTALRSQVEPLLARTGRTLSQAGRTLTRTVSLPLIGAGVVAGKMALDFEKAFTQIAALSNASAEDIRRWRGEVLELAGRTAQAPQELAEGLFFLASAGLRAGQIMPTLEASAKAAASGMGEITDISKITANALNAYAGSGLKAADVTDTLAAAIREGSAEPDEFAGALGRILPIASKAGVEFDEVTASLAGLSNIGLDVNEATTAMRGLLQALVAPGSLAAETLKKVGISAQELRASIADEGVLGAMRLLDEATNGNIDRLRDIIPNIRALTAQFGLTGQEADKVSAIFSSVARSTGDLDKAFEETQKGAAFQFQQQLNELRIAAINLGQQLLPIGQKIVETVTDVVDTFSDLPPFVKDATATFAGFAVVVGPLVFTIGKLVSVFGALKSAFVGSQAVVGAATASMANQAAATASAAKASQLLVANASGAVVATRTVGATAATSAVSAGKLGGALTALSAPTVIAGLGVVALTLKGIQLLSQGIEDRIRGTVQQFRRGLVAIPDLIAAQRAVEGLIPSVSTARGTGVGAALTAGIDEEAIERIRKLQEQIDLLGDSQRLALARQAVADLTTEFRLGKITFGQYQEGIEQIEQVYTLFFPAGEKLIDQQQRLTSGLGRFADEVIGATGITDQQRKSLETLIPAFRDLGLRISEADQAQVEALISAGEYGKAIFLLQNDIRTGLTKALRQYQDDLKKSERNQIEAAIEAGNLKHAMELLKKAIEEVPDKKKVKVEADTDRARTAIEQIQQRVNTLTGRTYTVRIDASGNISTGVGGNVRGASGGIITGQHGGITRGPTLLAGEGQSATPFGRGTEGLIPFDQRGIRILSQALKLAIEQGRTGGDGGDIIGELRAIRRLLTGLELRLDGERVGRAVSRQQRRNRALAGDA